MLGKTLITLLVFDWFVESCGTESSTVLRPEAFAKVTKLATSLKKMQWTEERKYWPSSMFPPLQWEKNKGLFESYVSLNFHGEQEMSLGRHLTRIPDNNGFSTMFVVLSLLDAYKLGIADVADHDLENACQALLSHKDKNFPADVAAYGFWKQEEVEHKKNDGAEGKTYYQHPTNLLQPLENIDFFGGFFNHLLEKLGVARRSRQEEGHFWKSVVELFSIPADADDTGINLALGMHLYEQRTSFPLATSTWLKGNKINGKVFELFDNFAYRPFSKNIDENMIETRTYYWIRGFLQKMIDTHEDPNKLAIISTWLQKSSETSKKIHYSKMPWNANNVDLSVVVNAIFGMTSALLFQPDVYFVVFSKPSIQDLFSTTVKLLEWAVKTDALNTRPDLVLLYYPSRYDFYMFVARTVLLMDRLILNSDRLYKEGLGEYFLDLQWRLSTAMQKEGTNKLLVLAKHVGKGETLRMFWDDDLGNADTRWGKPMPKYEDRVYSTAAAVNALLDCWTIESTGKLEVRRRKLRRWKEQTPIEVMEAVEAGVRWLVKDSAKFARENMFFSASIKSFPESFPFYYPANVMRHANGTEMNCNETISVDSFDIIVGVSGMINETVYSKMLTQKCFGKPVQEKFEGTNCKHCYFPYWTSPAITDAFELLALSKYLVLVGDEPRQKESFQESSPVLKIA